MIPEPPGPTGQSPPAPEPPGLTSAEAARRLARWGPNEIAEPAPHPARDFARRLWGPVPWMLESGIGLELALHRFAQAAAFAALLLLNAVIAQVEESRAERALAGLRRRLTVRARVRRDGEWGLAPARELVPGDVVHVRLGDLVPADLRLSDGDLLLDQSAVTGEAAPVEAGAGSTIYAGTAVRRGEATGEVTATGRGTAFGRAADLVLAAQARTHLDRLIGRIVRYLVAVDAALAAAVAVYAWRAGLPASPVIEYILILLIASVPVALPATFTLATALGAHALAARGVLVSRLSTVEDAAAMDVLCADKTGTITRNALTVAAVEPLPPSTNEDVLRAAVACSSDATQDPIDLAILDAARARGLVVAQGGAPGAERIAFTPFDPATKRSEAVVRTARGELRVAKGAAAVIAALHPADSRLLAAEARLSTGGLRVIGVAAGARDTMRPIGAIGLEDPARDDSSALLARLRALGVRVIMVTGDSAPTARAIAGAVGIGDRLCAVARIDDRGAPTPSLDACDVFAGVFPADKVRLVAALQREGRIVGMTGDGVNDAAALRQAEVGIAVARAVDVAKSAAGVVLTTPGLGGILDVVDGGRRIYRRMLTYTMNKIAKTFHIAMFLAAGLLLTGIFVTTPTLILLLLLANDLVTMSIATDHVAPSPRPDRWNVRAVAAGALSLAVAWLVLTMGVFVVGRDVLHYDVARLQTLGFLTLVLTGQATVYIVRTDGWLWSTRPSAWLLAGSALDLAAVTAMAVRGVLMAPVAARVVGALLVLVAAATLAIDAAVVVVRRHWAARRAPA